MKLRFHVFSVPFTNDPWSFTFICWALRIFFGDWLMSFVCPNKYSKISNRYKSKTKSSTTKRAKVWSFLWFQLRPMATHWTASSGRTRQCTSPWDRDWRNVLGDSQLMMSVFTPPKSHMEPEKGQLEKETHLQLQTTHFLGCSMWVFRGKYIFKRCIFMHFPAIICSQNDSTRMCYGFPIGSHGSTVYVYLLVVPIKINISTIHVNMYI